MSPRKLDYNTCYQIAKQCKYKDDLFHLDKGVYRKAYETGWIYEWFPDRKPAFLSQPSYITNAEIIAAAKKYYTVQEFSHHENHMYCLAGKRGLIPSLRWLKHADRSKIHIKYTDDDIIKEAIKYSSRHDFAIHNVSMYSNAVRRKIFTKYNILPLKEEYAIRGCRDCVYVYEFTDDRVAYIGRTIAPRQRHRAHCKSGDSVYEYAQSRNMEIPSPKYVVDGVLPPEGAKIECETIDLYKKNGWTLLNKKSGGSLGTLRAGINTYAYCMKIARKFRTFTDMRKHADGVYQAIKKNGWIKDCTWLSYKKTPPGTWVNASKDDIFNEAAKYKTITQFMRKAAGAYFRARREGWLDELFPNVHRPKPVLQFTKDGIFVAEYPNAEAAATQLGIAAWNILRVCNPDYRRKSTHGYVFKYKYSTPTPSR